MKDSLNENIIKRNWYYKARIKISQSKCNQVENDIKWADTVKPKYKYGRTFQERIYCVLNKLLMLNI